MTKTLPDNLFDGFDELSVKHRGIVCMIILEGYGGAASENEVISTFISENSKELLDIMDDLLGIDDIPTAYPELWEKYHD